MMQLEVGESGNVEEEEEGRIGMGSVTKLT